MSGSAAGPGSGEACALRVEGLTKRFGGLPALRDVALTVGEGERHLILGPNGSGKTTLFNLVTGDLRSNAGKITLFGEDITALPVARRVHLGIARTYQLITLFPKDTLVHNVVLAVLGLLPTRWNTFNDLDRYGALSETAERVLDTVGLRHLAHRALREVAYGEQRRVELAMALAQRPKLLLLDEPLAGLSESERADVARLLDEIPRSVTVVMIEHDMDVALSFAERITLLHHGEVVTAGTRAEVVANPKTREIYLGA